MSVRSYAQVLTANLPDEFEGGYCYLRLFPEERRHELRHRYGPRATIGAILYEDCMESLDHLVVEPCGPGNLHCRERRPGEPLWEANAFMLEYMDRLDYEIGGPKDEVAYGGPFDKVVTVDVPDPDNFLMVLTIIRENSGLPVAVTLTPRPVSFSAVPYGSKFGEEKLKLQAAGLTSEQALGAMLTPSDHDLGLRDQQVMHDTELYMRLSWLRLVEFLDDHDVPREAYCLYTDLDVYRLNTLAVGLAHRAHKPDFTYGFSADELRAYSAAVKRAQASGLGYSLAFGREVYQLCASWVSRKLPQLAADGRLVKGRVFELAVALQKKGSEDEKVGYVGGPFSDILSLMPGVDFSKIYAMAGFIDGSVNLFRNQFNIMVDPESASDVFKGADEGEYQLVLLPTECAKAPSMLVTKDQMVKAGVSQAVLTLYEAWDPKVAKYALFDWMLAVEASGLVQFPRRSVTWKIEDGVFKFYDKGVTGDSMVMCWHDESPEKLPDRQMVKFSILGALGGTLGA